MLVILLCIAAGISGGLIGRAKGSSFWIWALVCAVPPFFGLMAVALYRVERDELRRQCPSCGSIRMLHDAICTRCGAELDFPDVAIEPESHAELRRRAPAP